MYLHFLKDVPEMVLYGLLGDKQLLSNFSVPQSGHDHRRNLFLPQRQTEAVKLRPKVAS
jgi:hypothetical protein